MVLRALGQQRQAVLILHDKHMPALERRVAVCKEICQTYFSRLGETRAPQKSWTVTAGAADLKNLLDSWVHFFGDGERHLLVPSGNTALWAERYATLAAFEILFPYVERQIYFEAFLRRDISEGFFTPWIEIPEWAVTAMMSPAWYRGT